MRKQTLLDFLCVVLVGRDNAKGLVPFTPEMVSFSNKFDFDPLHGSVEDFSQALSNDRGEVTRHVTGTLLQEGCFDTLELHDIKNNTGMTLVLDTNYYRDAEALEKRIRLQGKCQLVELPATGVVRGTDDNGFVISATRREMKVQYRYDVEGYPLGETTVSKDSTLQVDTKPSVDPLKKLDHTAVSMLNSHPLSNVKQTCKYDEYANPINCQLIVVDEDMKPTVEHHYSVGNTIGYY